MAFEILFGAAMDKQRLILGADHAGAPLKDFLCSKLTDAGYPIEDLGTRAGERVDYPEYGTKVAQAVSTEDGTEGILVCGTGIGMSIVANKVAGVRAALVHDPFTSRMAREHNNANVLVLGGRLMADEYAWTCVQEWLGGDFEARHQTRLDMISALEKVEG
jgi:ribose 5-phosphate isomerase B